MKFKRHSKLEHGLAQIDIAPLIDVIFQLLIFFMLTSSFTFPSAIKVKLPRAVTSDTIKADNHVITITGENIIYFNNALITLKEFQNQLPAIKASQRPLLIKSDRRASVGRVVDVWDLCRKSGIEKINIATDHKN